jgi:hypothetical protein
MEYFIIFFFIFCALYFEIVVRDIKHYGFPSLGDSRLTRDIPSLVFFPIICILFIAKYPSFNLIYSIPIYIVLRLLLDRWYKKRWIVKLSTRPEHPNMSGRILNIDLVKSELSKYESGNFEFIVMEGISPDTQWLQIAKEKDGYLLNLSPDLKVDCAGLSVGEIPKIIDLGKIRDNRVFRVICKNVDDGAMATSAVLNRCKGLEKVYNITYE